jgi:predicted lipoprotein with Yx(FWY)xxD motif
MQSRLITTAATVFAAVILAGCGGSAATSTGVASPSSSPPASPASAGATVKVATDAKLGQILVDGSGKTLYLFVKDTGTVSTCYTSCAQFWPPIVTTGPPQAGAGAQASLLGTTQRTDGTTEVTYAGHPLYFFLSDQAAGDTKGQGVDGFGGLWWVLDPTGKAITKK